ncbi:MFS transporter [Acidianus sulfidivorans JP7]|uniref:Major facilitator superfamily (MFS) profile domain-containing protein n=1 Tax=Acidianus sulfidivorans JP7 TaxID=619593 RepID=A0A2U9IPJ7_9CREN|nr:MFS transporter [Acidianus sulfidivorans]AWR97979.1 MFS transporter [Acidianus sulfidivorans JP7]
MDRLAKLTLISLLITYFIGGLELTIAGSLNQLIADSLNSNSFAGTILSSYLIGGVIGSFFFGFLADKYGRKKTLEIGLLIFVLSSIIITLSQNIFEVILLLAIQGFAINGDGVAGSSLIVEVAPSKLRGKMFVILSTIWFLGDMVASFLGLYLLSVLPPYLSWRISFAIAGVIVVPFSLVRFMLKESTVWENFGKRKIKLESVRNLLISLVIISSIDSIVTYVFPFLILPDFIGPALGLNATKSAEFTDEAILAATLASILGGFTLVQILIDRLSRKSSVLLGHIYMLLGFLIMVIGLSSSAFIIGDFALISFLSPLGLFAISLLSVESFPSSLRAKANGIVSGISSIVSSISPLVYYYYLSGIGVRNLVLSLVGLISIAVITILFTKIQDNRNIEITQVEKYYQTVES